jgi:molybdopterin-biosynthesis enzyme MoeA-like protein
VVNEYRAEYDAVVVTGGVGPTHDDVTMEGVATALGRDLVSSDDAREWLERDGYADTDLVEGTTHLPEGARMLENPEGVAPGAAVEGVYVLPGVPAEMQAMFASVEAEFEGDPRHVVEVETTEPESALIDRLREVRERFEVTVGSYPGETVRLKVVATDPDTAATAADWLRERVDT